jgi:hypothetical protein
MIALQKSETRRDDMEVDFNGNVPSIASPRGLDYCCPDDLTRIRPAIKAMNDSSHCHRDDGWWKGKSSKK